MANRIKLTFLGTSGAIPTAKRNHTGILLNYEGENILVDCGEGIQRQFRRAKLNPCKITKILITHWHGDHVLGLPGLLQTLALSEYNKELTIYGPYGTKKFVENIFNIFNFINKFKFNVVEIDTNGKFFENDEFYLESKKLFHNISCLGYNFVKKGERKIYKSKLKKFGIPECPLLQNIKGGKSIVYNNKRYLPEQLTYKDKDLKVSFVLDTRFNNEIISFVKDSDILVCDATFEPGMEDLAETHNHMTAKQAAEIAKKAKAKKLVLTHISERYERKLESVLKEVSKIFKGSFMVNDLYVVEI